MRFKTPPRKRWTWLGTALLFVLGAPLAWGAAPPPRGPILFFDSFEVPHKYWRNATAAADKGTRPKTRSVKLGRASWDDKVAWTYLRLSGARVKLPPNIPSNRVYVGFKLFGKDLKQVRVEFNDGSKGYTYYSTSPREGRWFDVVASMGQARASNRRIPKNFKLNQIKIFVYSRSGGAPEVYLDDFLLSVGVSPKALWPRALALEMQRAKQETTAQAQGFAFTMGMEAAMKAALHQARVRPKPQTVLPVALGPHAAAFGATLKETLKRRTVNPVELPQGLVLKTLSDLRAMLPYVLARHPSETVLIAPSAQALARSQGRPEAHAEVISKRCLAAGAIPVWVLPTLFKKNEKDWTYRNLKRTTAALALALQKAGVPYVDAEFALKGDAAVFDKKRALNAAGYQKLAPLAGTAIAHVLRYVRGR